MLNYTPEVTENMVPTASGVSTIGTQALAFSAVNAGIVRGDYGYFTNLNFSGIIPATKLGTGAPSASNYLRGDGTWATASSGMAYTDARIKVGTYTSGANPTGDASVTGVGFQPKYINIQAVCNANSIPYSNGFSDGTTHTCVYDMHTLAGDGPVWTQSTAAVIHVLGNGLSGNTAIIKSFDADGFTLTWTQVSGGQGNTVKLSYIAYR